jgi:TonB family protein
VRNLLIAITFLLLSGAVYSASAQQRDTVKANTSTSEEYIDVSEEPKEITPIEQFLVYPDSEKRAGIEGKVVLQALIGKDGHVEKANSFTATDDNFKREAIEAVLKTKYSPAKQNGTPLRLWITRTVIFKLHQ